MARPAIPGPKLMSDAMIPRSLRRLYLDEVAVDLLSCTADGCQVLVPQRAHGAAAFVGRQWGSLMSQSSLRTEAVFDWPPEIDPSR